MVNRISEGGSNAPYTKSKGESINNIAEDTKLSALSISTQSNLIPSQMDLEDETLPVEKVQQMTDSLNSILETTNSKLKFEFHDELEKYYVTLVDAETEEIVKEIPNKKLMDMYAAMLDFLGLVIDKKI